MNTNENTRNDLQQFSDLWADLTASFLDNLRLTYSNPFAEFPHLKIVECRVRFDFEETPYFIMIEGVRQ